VSESMLSVQPTGQNCDIMLIGRCGVKKRTATFKIFGIRHANGTYY